MMPPQLKLAFKYIQTLQYDEKPNYNLIKLFMSLSSEDEELALSSKLKANNQVYANMVQNGRPRKEIIAPSNKSEDDNESEYSFDEGCDELGNSNSVNDNIQKIDIEQVQKIQLREILVHNRNLASIRKLTQGESEEIVWSIVPLSVKNRFSYLLNSESEKN